MYKFKEDGTINIVLSGRVTRGTWEYDPSDKTIIISASNQSYMVHPGMYDDMLLALQVDGTDQCSFLIEEDNSQKFAPKTYSDLMLFFKEKERKVLEEEERIRLLKEEEERARKKAAEEKKKWEEEHKEEIDDDKIIEDFRLFLRENHFKRYGLLYIFALVIPFIIFVILPLFILPFILGAYFDLGKYSFAFLFLISYILIFKLITYFQDYIVEKDGWVAGRLLNEFVCQAQYIGKIDDKLFQRLLYVFEEF